jgi:outer membrane protein assembly factor BamE (lipoprotein component of BamABCDE complex)
MYYSLDMQAEFRWIRLALLLTSIVLLSACVKYQSMNGVKNTWREIPTDTFQKGVTTQTEILDRLGPPSQIIALGDQTVFYYLSQLKSGTAKVLIIWNDAKDQTRYDRAVFFFDQQGILAEFSISDEATETQ